MDTRKKLALAGATVLAMGAGGTGIAMATSDDDGSDTAITGSALDQASTAALDYTGEGSVSGTEVGDEESYYEVEVTRDDGSEIDVQLDRGFNVVSDELETGGEESDG